GIQERRQRQQPQRFERAPFDRQRGQDLRQLARRAQREDAVRRDEADGFGRRRLPLRDLLRIGRRPQPRQPLGAHRRQREAGDRLDDPIEFEGPQGAWLHGRGNLTYYRTDSRRDWGLGVRD